MMNNLRDERIWGDELCHVTKVSVSLRKSNDVIDIINEKRKCCAHRCPDSVYFHTLLLIIYLSAFETLTCRRPEK